MRRLRPQPGFVVQYSSRYFRFGLTVRAVRPYIHVGTKRQSYLYSSMQLILLATCRMREAYVFAQYFFLFLLAGWLVGLGPESGRYDGPPGIFGVAQRVDPVSYTHLTLPTNREV